MFRGIIAMLTVTNPPLYRYPYRNSQEAFRADWKKVGSDIEAATVVFEDGQERENDGQREQV